MKKYYFNLLGYPEIPSFLNKYLVAPSLVRLKEIGYFCGMDYASQSIYPFKEYISRYDHSLSVALLIYHLTKDPRTTLIGLFHDIATPCFSHVIDYLNCDYEKQESTEAYTASVLNNDCYLKKCLEEDKIKLLDLINFKKFSLVDNERPKLCADRIDGIILTGIGWVQNLTKLDLKQIVADLTIYQNEENEPEIGFQSLEIATKVMKLNNQIDLLCRSNHDFYMMKLLAQIISEAISQGYLSYEALFYLKETELWEQLNQIPISKLKQLIKQFRTIKKDDIPLVKIPKLKLRRIDPLVQGRRFSIINK